LHALLQTVIPRLMKRLTRRGVLIEEVGQPCLAEPDANGEEARTLRPLQAAAITYRIALGPGAGQTVLTLRGAATCERPETCRLASHGHGEARLLVLEPSADPASSLCWALPMASDGV
jgi:hypothetical protein